MTGLLDRVRSFLRSLFGGDDADAAADEPAAETAAEPEPADAEPETYVCSVCGTPVDDRNARCPLCKSYDIVAASEFRDWDGEGGDGGAEAPPGLDPQSATVARSAGSSDEAVDRLNRLREAEREHAAEDGEADPEGGADPESGDDEREADGERQDLPDGDTEDGQ